MKSWLKTVTRSRIIVHTKSGLTFRGLLEVEARDGLVLRAAELISGPKQSDELPSETWIPREEVAFAQRDDQ